MSLLSCSKDFFERRLNYMRNYIIFSLFNESQEGVPIFKVFAKGHREPKVIKSKTLVNNRKLKTGCNNHGRLKPHMPPKPMFVSPWSSWRLTTSPGAGKEARQFCLVFLVFQSVWLHSPVLPPVYPDWNKCSISLTLWHFGLWAILDDFSELIIIIRGFKECSHVYVYVCINVIYYALFWIKPMYFHFITTHFKVILAFLEPFILKRNDLTLSSVLWSAVSSAK